MDLNQPGGCSPNHAVILYSIPFRECAETSSPVVCFELIDTQELEGTIAFLQIFFPFQAEPTIRFSAIDALIDLNPSLMPTLVEDFGGLLQMIPMINCWLEDWASSPERRPSLEPDWARHHGLGPETVRYISVAMLGSLTRSRERSISLRSAAGDRATLQIPARAQLVAPLPEGLSGQEYFEVCTKEAMGRYLTPGGKLVFIRAGESILAPSTTVTIDSRSLFRTRIKTSPHVSIAAGRAGHGESS